MAAEPTPASATAPAEPERPARGFIEAVGTWGLNLGETEYVPDGPPGDTKHPFATGFGAGAKVGFAIGPKWLAVFGDYRYGHTSTRKGEATGALTKAQGSLNFHTITVGLRIEKRLGSGRIYADFGAGILLPYTTKVEFEYAPELAAIGITGEGTMKDEFGIGFGALGEMGYHFDVAPSAYIGLGLRVQSYQSNNNGKDTELENFVTDFTALPPVPVTTTIHHSADGPIPPTTNSVQDVRLQLSVGYRF